MLAELVGGVGLFLLGMALMTDALKALSGDRLRRFLSRAADTRLKALATGTAATVLVQSSTATTVVTIGLVSAGLLTFQQSLGIIFGANLGTTSMAWIVSLLGLRFTLTTFVLPLIALGALVKVATRGLPAAVGLAVAGFGLLFVGIDLLQVGMADLAGDLPALSAADGWGQRIALVALGALITIVVQASGAAMATTLAAVHAGAIDLQSGAYLVIGQNIGTTLTAVVAGMAGSVAARRTAAAHVGFNLGTGIVAFALVVPFLAASTWAADRFLAGGDAVALAVFHTLFNVVGVALFLPAAGPLARGLERLIPERGPRLGRQLDATAADVPGIAIEAVRRTLAETTREAMRALRSQLETPSLGRQAQRSVDACKAALGRTRDFLAALRAGPETAFDTARLEASLHALDHLDNLLAHAAKPTSVSALASQTRFGPAVVRFRDGIAAAEAWLAAEDWAASWEPARRHLAGLPEVRRALRGQVLRTVAQGGADLDSTMGHLDALSWLDQEAHHLQRILHYLSEPPPTAPPVPAAAAGQSVTA